MLDGGKLGAYGGVMEVVFQIPDELANTMAAAGDLSRRALEAFALEELRAGAHHGITTGRDARLSPYPDGWLPEVSRRVRRIHSGRL